jgi:hypothetical protein
MCRLKDGGVDYMGEYAFKVTLVELGKIHKFVSCELPMDVPRATLTHQWRYFFVVTGTKRIINFSSPVPVEISPRDFRWQNKNNMLADLTRG